MADEWQELTWGDLATLEYGHALQDYKNGTGKYRVFGTNGPIGYCDIPLCSHASVIIGRKGAYRGVHFSSEQFFVIDTAFYLEAKKNFDIRWAYYELLTHNINGMDSGSAIPSTSRDDFYQLPVRVPPLKEQRAIAHILSTLDDKIELNRRMNETLEAIARTIFKSWFVDFDPIHAKADGSGTGLPKEIADLFPDSFEDSEVGKIPQGWHISTLGEHFEAVRGLSYKGSGLSDDGIPMHNLNSIYEGGGYKYEGIKYYNGGYDDRHVAYPGDVIVANTEQGHDELLIGYAAIVPHFYGNFGIFSHHIYRLCPLKTSYLTSSFIYHLLNSSKMHDTVSGHANGTTVNMLPIDGVQRPSFVCPNSHLVSIFDKLASNILLRQEQLVSESCILANLRDTLLPRLISGDLRVPDAERFIKEASP